MKVRAGDGGHRKEARRVVRAENGVRREDGDGTGGESGKRDAEDGAEGGGAEFANGGYDFDRGEGGGLRGREEKVPSVMITLRAVVVYH